LPFLSSPFGKTPWIGITMRSTFHHHKVGIKSHDRPVVNAIKALLFKRATRTAGLRTLLTIDPTLPEWSARNLSKASAAVAYVADPFPDDRAENPVLARERLGLDPSARYLLVYGAISERKGIYELVHALTRMEHAPTLIVAGEQDAGTRHFMRNHVRSLNPAPLVLDSFIANEVERDLFSACDAVWLGYKGHYGMSGVLVQAYRFGKPVIATEDGLIGWFSRRCELGPILSDLSSASIGNAVTEIMTSWPHAPQTTPSAREDLLSRHTLGQFKQTLLQQMA
jgi:glycosyltransferase involved in cell wall biosynthesis